MMRPALAQTTSRYFSNCLPPCQISLVPSKQTKTAVHPLTAAFLFDSIPFCSVSNPSNSHSIPNHLHTLMKHTTKRLYRPPHKYYTYDVNDDDKQ